MVEPKVVAEAVAEAAGGAAGLCPVGSFRVKGRREGLEVFTLVEGAIDDWEAALDLVRRGEFAAARDAMAAMPAESPLAGAVRFYQGWIKRWIAEPPADWDGVVTLESK